MRDKRFVLEHRGGPLKKEQHLQLMQWACDVAQHVLSLLGETTDERILNALIVANDWKEGNASVGDARKASVAVIAAANESSNMTQTLVARSIGHAVATAHMADHSLVAAWYALKAVKNADGSVDKERTWQNNQLSSEIKELVLSARNAKRFEKI
jgi:hypothetical protein